MAIAMAVVLTCLLVVLAGIFLRRPLDSCECKGRVCSVDDCDGERVEFRRPSLAYIVSRLLRDPWAITRTSQYYYASVYDRSGTLATESPVMRVWEPSVVFTDAGVMIDMTVIWDGQEWSSLDPSHTWLD